jgi:hypothetical protein
MYEAETLALWTLKQVMEDEVIPFPKFNYALDNNGHWVDTETLRLRGLMVDN